VDCSLESPHPHELTWQLSQAPCHLLKCPLPGVRPNQALHSTPAATGQKGQAQPTSQKNLLEIVVAAQVGSICH
jgi:hypothetical protein